MKHLYCNRLRKNKDINIHNNSKSSYPLKQYINNGNRLNSFSALNKIGVNRSENLNYLIHSNNLVKSYNQSGAYMQNYKNKNTSKCNNHSLYDSNKRQIINIENSHNFIRFESNNLEKEKINKINKNNYLSTNNSIYNSIKSKNNKNNNNNSNNNIRNYTFQKNYFNNNITNINYNIKIQNFTNKKNNNNSIATINYSNSNKNNKYINNINNETLQNRNYLSSLKKNYNFTEINDTKKKKTPSGIKHQKREPMQRNLTENNYRKEKENNKDKESRSTSIIKTQIFNNVKKDRNNITDKTNTNTHIYDFKEQKYNINLPIKLNIEDINKEKLSRLKRIIEQGSTNLNYYKMETSKNFYENSEKTQGKNSKVKKGKSQYIFKKKKINMIKKEESKEDDTKNNNQKSSNNFFNKSPIKKMNKKKNLILNTQLKNTNTNYKLQSAMNSHNLFIRNGKNKYTEYNREKKHQRIKANEINNSINDDTISLSYSKEQNISFFSKKMNINEKNLYLPFSIEQFNIYYNNINKNLIINDKNNKKFNNNESDDDDYQLTKEIILLKRGLAKKSELSAEIRKKIRNMKTQRIYTLNLLGNKKVYRKKTNNYKITKL